MAPSTSHSSVSTSGRRGRRARRARSRPWSRRRARRAPRADRRAAPRRPGSRSRSASASPSPGVSVEQRPQLLDGPIGLGQLLLVETGALQEQHAALVGPIGDLDLARVDLAELAAGAGAEVQLRQRVQRLHVVGVDLEDRLPGAHRLLRLLERLLVEDGDPLGDHLPLVAVDGHLQVPLQHLDQLSGARPAPASSRSSARKASRSSGRRPAPSARPRWRRAFRRGAPPAAWPRRSTAGPADRDRSPRRRPSAASPPAGRRAWRRGPASPSPTAPRPIRRRRARRGCGTRTPDRAARGAGRSRPSRRGSSPARSRSSTVSSCASSAPTSLLRSPARR